MTRKNVVVGASAKSKCPSGSHKISVGVHGPRGAAGATGATGATGPAGPQGLPGTAGIFGPAANTPYDVDPGGSANGTITKRTLGEIKLTAASFAFGTPARGQILSISQNTALFSLLGTNFGGNGQTTFALPDLRNSAPKGLIYGICTQGIFPARN